MRFQIQLDIQKSYAFIFPTILSRGKYGNCEFDLWQLVNESTDMSFN